MILPGIVTNITAFGAFVDVGVKQDGLVHVSQLADKFVKDPNEVVKLQQVVTVRVVEVDLARKRIALSMKFVVASSSLPVGRFDDALCFTTRAASHLPQPFLDSCSTVIQFPSAFTTASSSSRLSCVNTNVVFS